MKFEKVKKSQATQVEYNVCPSCAASFRSENVALEHYISDHIESPECLKQVGELELIKFTSVEDLDTWIDYHDRHNEFHSETPRVPGWFIVVDDEDEYAEEGVHPRILHTAADYLYALKRDLQTKLSDVQTARALIGDIEKDY